MEEGRSNLAGHGRRPGAERRWTTAGFSKRCYGSVARAVLGMTSRTQTSLSNICTPRLLLPIRGTTPMPLCRLFASPAQRSSSRHAQTERRSATTAARCTAHAIWSSGSSIASSIFVESPLVTNSSLTATSCSRRLPVRLGTS